MTDRVLVEALRSRDPGALAALYDTHAAGVYRYCWSLLPNADSAQVALRDTLIAAEAHIGALADPDRLRVWLYALARVECLRRRAAVLPGGEEGEPPAADDPEEADLRITAWNALHGLPSEERELLELIHVHRFPAAELAVVLATGVRRLEEDLAEARTRLRDAVTAEILARKGPYDCPRRAEILTGYAGRLTVEIRDRLVRHLPCCAVCAPHRLRQVSTDRVFALLPEAGLPESLRVRVLSCFVDPELVPYRSYVARRSGALDAAGFPVPEERRPRRWSRALVGALAGLAAMTAVTAAFHYFGTELHTPSGEEAPPSWQPHLLNPALHRLGRPT